MKRTLTLIILALCFTASAQVSTTLLFKEGIVIGDGNIYMSGDTVFCDTTELAAAKETIRELRGFLSWTAERLEDYSKAFNMMALELEAHKISYDLLKQRYDMLVQEKRRKQ